MAPSRRAAVKDKENEPVLQKVVKGGRKKDIQPSKKDVEVADRNSGVGLAERGSSADNIVEELTRKLEEVTLEKKKVDELLLLKDADIARKQRENEELAASMKAAVEGKDAEREKLVRKLQKVEAQSFIPTLDFAVPAIVEEEKKKDPRKPKKPLSAFLCWSADARKKVVAESPSLKFEEIAELLGKNWRALSADDKAPYEQQAKAAAELYAEERRAYDEMIAKEVKDAQALKAYQEKQQQEAAMKLLAQYQAHQKEAAGVKGKKAARDPEKPKQAMTAFLAFYKAKMAEMRLAGGKVNPIEVSKELGAKWSSITEKEKTVYEKLAAEDKERYMKEMAAYTQKKGEASATMKKEQARQQETELAEGMKIMEEMEKQALKLKKLKQAAKEQMEVRKVERALLRDAKKARDPNKPKRPPTGFILFSNDYRKQFLEQNTGATFAQISVATSVKWKELGEEDKRKWNESSAPLWTEYNAKMAEYREKHGDDASSVAPSDMSYQL